MFNIEQTTFLQEVIKQEYKDFTETSKIDTEETENPFIEGNVLYNLRSNAESVTSLLETSWRTNNESTINGNHVKGYFRAITTSIIRPKDKMPLNEALQTIYEVRASLGSEFAGALLVSGKTILNPLHPLTALCLLDDESYNSLEYSMVVYTYGGKRETLDETYNSYSLNRDLAITNINDIIRTFTSRVKHRSTKVIDSLVHPRNKSTINQTYKVAKYDGEQDNEELYLVTHQILTQGIVAPYYGTSIIKLNGSTSGIPCSPFRSVNLTSYRREAESTTPHGANVCTGNIPNNTLKGLRTLTHANLSSPYTWDAMEAGALVYAEMCMDKSFELYALAKLIKELPDESIKPFNTEFIRPQPETSEPVEEDRADEIPF